MSFLGRFAGDALDLALQISVGQREKLNGELVSIPAFSFCEALGLHSPFEPILRGPSAKSFHLQLGKVSWCGRAFLARHDRVRDVLIFVVPSHVEATGFSILMAKFYISK